jgi:hypothetical protein
MNLFLNKDTFTAEVQTWRNFANNLHSEKDKELFKKMLNNYCNYADLIVNANGERFPSESLVIALILSQHKKMINWLISKISTKAY